MKPTADPVHIAIEYTLRQDRGRLIAALVAAIGNFELAEECLQDATIAALSDWAKNGIPKSRRGWLLQVARRRAFDQFRRQKRLGQWRPQLEQMAQEGEMDANAMPPDIPDKRLELIFTCCHPALDTKSRVALTLRTIGGLTTREIARAFLDRETTMGQRLSRARAKITASGIPFAVPGPELWTERLESLLSVIYLIFNEGYSASSGDAAIRVELCEEAIYLARLLDKLRPGEPEILGLLSLMQSTHARRNARMSSDGETIGLADQDRSLWDQDMVEEGLELLDQAMGIGDAGPYQIKAAISALHVSAGVAKRTDWQQIALLYARLLHFEPTAIVRLNRAVARAEFGQLDQALSEMDQLAAELADYQPLYAAQAEYLARKGDVAAALEAYDKAIALSGNMPDRVFLSKRRSKLVH